MSKIAMVLLGMLALSNCTEQAQTITAPDGLIVRTGTSYGMCVGYCQTEYVINQNRTVLTQRGNGAQPTPQPKTCETATNSATWSKLASGVNVTEFSKLPERIGCPDCADGGAEFVEIQLGDQKHRVTFEVGQTIPGYESLVEQLRQYRTTFSGCQ